MKLCLNKMLYAFSYALDCVEKDYYQRTSYHGKRVAYLCMMMGESYHLSTDEMSYLLGCAILHDNGMTEYYKYGDDLEDKELLKIHSQAGENNIMFLPFYHQVIDVIKYHHEMANGEGPFHVLSEETPLFSRIIHIADWADVHYNLLKMNENEYQDMMRDFDNLRGIEFTNETVDIFQKVVTYQVIDEAREDLNQHLQESIHNHYHDFTTSELLSICHLFAKIIDSKSPHTKSHSIGVASRAARMGIFYKYDEEMITTLFFAGTMHDIGKLVIHRDILEKPAQLTDQEYTYIQTHAYYTFKILSDMELGDIIHWSSFHHEKLDGTGYPFGKKENELDFIDKLMACCDIYQALHEDRPYKKAISHENTIAIMKKMVLGHKIDGQIVDDMDKVFKEK